MLVQYELTCVIKSLDSYTCRLMRESMYMLCLNINIKKESVSRVVNNTNKLYCNNQYQYRDPKVLH